MSKMGGAKMSSSVNVRVENDLQSDLDSTHADVTPLTTTIIEF